MSWWVAAVLGVIVVLATAIWWWLPKWEVNRRRFQIRDAKARADVEDNFRKAIAQLFGGAAVLAGAATAYYQIQQTLQASNNQLKAAHDQLISQQVSKGFEQLGSDKIVVRLGGIYALEGVMKGSKEYYYPILDALCAFVRDNTKDTPKFAHGPPATDIQATLTVVGRQEDRTEGVDLSGVRIPKGRLLDANLNSADVSSGDLSSTDLRHAKLRGAALGSAELRNADLSGADLSNADLIGASLRGAHLYHADLSGAGLINT